jgi:hypothetical protein
MIHYCFEYPGDPPSQIIEMTRAEFQQGFRPSHWTISDLDGGNASTGVIEPEDIRCDSCNDNPGDTVYVWIYGRGGCRGYCKTCFDERFKKHCTKLE